MLLPSGPTTPEAVSELATAGARAVIVDGPIPAGSLGVDEPVQVPSSACRAAVAAEVRARWPQGPRRARVGAAAFGDNADLGAVAPFSSTGLAFDGGEGTELAAPGVGLVTSVPGRGEGGSARYGTLSGSSAAAAVVAGAAALLAEARPDLDAAGLRGALVASARRTTGGTEPGIVDPRRPRPQSSSPTRPSPRSGARRQAAGGRRARHPAQRLAARPRRAPPTGGGDRGGRGARRARPRRPPARDVERIAVSIAARVRPAAPGALRGVVRAVVGPRGASSDPVDRGRPRGPARRSPAWRSRAKPSPRVTGSPPC